MKKEAFYRFLDKHPVYINGVNLRFILELHSSVQEAMERGELDEGEVAFVRYLRGFIAGLLSLVLLVVLFTCFIFPAVLSRTDHDAAIIGLFFVGFFTIIFVPNRFFHKSLKEDCRNNSGAKVIRIITMVAYAFSWLALSVLLLLAVVFLSMVFAA